VSITGPTTPIAVSAPASFTVTVGTTVPVTNVRVDFGDGSAVQNLGQLSGTQTIQHVFSRSDLFNVSVSATDPDGTVVTGQTQVAVVSISGSVAVTATGTTFPKTATGTVTLSNTSSSIDHIDWDFGDSGGAFSQTSFGLTQTHTYTSG